MGGRGGGGGRRRARTYAPCPDPTFTNSYTHTHTHTATTTNPTRATPQRNTLVVSLCNFLFRGVEAAVAGAPDSLHLFGLLSHYLHLLPIGATYFEPQLRYMDQQIRLVVGRSDAAALVKAARRWWFARKDVASDEDVVMGTQSADFGGYTAEQLRPWAPAMAFRNVLGEKGGRGGGGGCN